MDNKQIFRKYYGRLAFEGVLKALVWGFAVGLLAFTVTAFICWAVSYDPGIWIALGIGVAAIPSHRKGDRPQDRRARIGRAHDHDGGIAEERHIHCNASA